MLRRRSSEASVDCLPKRDFRFVLSLNRESRPPNFSTPIARLQQIRAASCLRRDSPSKESEPVQLLGPNSKNPSVGFIGDGTGDSAAMLAAPLIHLTAFSFTAF